MKWAMREALYSTRYAGEARCTHRASTWAGEYCAEKKPDRIIHIGDHWDMPSLSSFDVGKKAFEGRTYASDIQAGLGWNGRVP
jgi:hypothetical protein